MSDDIEVFEDKSAKAGRINSGIAMIRLVLRDPKLRRFLSILKQEIDDGMAELARIGAEIWPANMAPIPKEYVNKPHSGGRGAYNGRKT